MAEIILPIAREGVQINMDNLFGPIMHAINLLEQANGLDSRRFRVAVVMGGFVPDTNLMDDIAQSISDLESHVGLPSSHAGRVIAGEHMTAKLFIQITDALKHIIDKTEGYTYAEVHL